MTWFVSSTGLGEAKADAAVLGEAGYRVAARRQRNAALEPSLRQFEAENSSAAQFRGQHAAPADNERSPLEQGFDLIWIDAWQGNENETFTVGFQHVDRRLPARLARASPWLQIQELLVQAFGAGKGLNGLGQHPVDGVFARHRVSPVS